MSLSDWLFIGAAVTGVLALLAIGSTFGRPRGNFLRWCAALLLLAMALPMGGLGLLLRHYTWLIEDQPVAIIALKQVAPQRFQATLVPTGQAGDRTGTARRRMAAGCPGHSLAAAGRTGRPAPGLSPGAIVRPLRRSEGRTGQATQRA